MQEQMLKKKHGLNWKQEKWKQEKEGESSSERRQRGCSTPIKSGSNDNDPYANFIMAQQIADQSI